MNNDYAEAYRAAMRASKLRISRILQGDQREMVSGIIDEFFESDAYKIDIVYWDRDAAYWKVTLSKYPAIWYPPVRNIPGGLYSWESSDPVEFRTRDEVLDSMANMVVLVSAWSERVSVSMPYDGHDILRSARKLSQFRDLIKEELMTRAWAPSRHVDWCLSIDERRDLGYEVI